jgi:hypothetical protein
MMSAAHSNTIAPREFALLLLASDDLLPRQRARDQQADRAGLDLMRRLLDRVAAIDPEPQEFESVLMQVAGELGTPAGPARAVAATVLEDWKNAVASPAFVDHLLQQALGSETKETKGR